MSQKVALIAGAGPAGLTAAYELLKRTEIKPIIFEETSAIGGIAQTYNYKGNRIDIGGHRFFSKSDRVMNWWFNILPLQGAPAADTLEKAHDIDYATEIIIDLLCPEWTKEGLIDRNLAVNSLQGIKIQAPDPEKEDMVMLQRPRLSRIFYRRSFYPYPLGITFRVARQLGLWNTFLIGMSYIKAQLFPVQDETYLDAFFINRFGKRLYETFFKDYTEKVWGIACDKIRADWGAQRIKGLSLKRALVHAVQDLLSSDFQKAQQERETSLITRFYYPKYGPGQIWETVAEQLIACGGEIHHKHRVCGVELEDGRVKTVIVENLTSGQKREFLADYFFSTMPIKHLVSMLKPKTPEKVTVVADGLQYRDFLTVGLLLRKLNVLEKAKATAANVPDNWIYVQDGDVKVGRIQIFNNWSPYMVADRKNTVWIGLEYFASQGDEIWEMKDNELIQLGVSELERIGFLMSDDLLDACVLRMPKAYPAYFGTYDQLDEIKDYFNTIPNLFLIGRNGMHRYNNQDHSMLTAMMAVDNIIEGRFDKTNLWDVNLEMVYHEEK
ncbi:MAG: NAD(P)/FAD-dependent oxidoreductase [Blastocatellia bacterium]|nr:NAD(P)/FAD-dependent oxidoreductase [Blastocatellia bacterium]